MPLRQTRCYTRPERAPVPYFPSVISLEEEDKRLLTAAHDVLREGQRRLHALSEEARILYQHRLQEWEECRRSLDELAGLLNSQAGIVEIDAMPMANLEARAGLLEHEAHLREEHSRLAEKVYRLQRAVRLLSAAIRHLETESSRILDGGDGSLLGQEEEPQADFHERVLQAYEQERIRLAREIHDGPAQVMANAIFEMEFVERVAERDPSALGEQLARLKAEMRDGLSEVRRFIFDLRPPALAEKGLFGALRDYLLEFEKHFGIAVEADLPNLQQRPPASKETAIFRIVQEALQNVQKHGGATRVVVRGELKGHLLRLCVEDNGRGFAMSEVATRRTRSLGLISMRERAELIDAQLDIRSAPGAGTRVCLAVPLGTDP